MTSSTEKQKSDGVCEYEQNLSILRDLPLFREVPLESMQALAYLCKRMRYKEGDILFGQGEDDSQAYYILEGETELLHTSGDAAHIVGGYGAGSFIGGLTLLADVRRLYSLRAKTNVYCIVLSRRKITSDPAKAGAFLQAYGRAITQSIVDWEHRMLQDAAGAGLEKESSIRLGVSLV